MSEREKRIKELEMLIVDSESELALLFAEEEEDREPELTAADEYEDRRDHERAHGPWRSG